MLGVLARRSRSWQPPLAARERILGAQHPHALLTCHSLAQAYHDAGRVSDAIAIFEPLLAARKRILGTEHPEALRTCHSLAHAYQEVGRTADAERLRKLRQ